ncbi:MAG TPA: cytochrome C oxidase subunit IV family protein [Candidatus Binatus sp.]|nr:cytochrome C oxidase subunit IV family protein [Candidatus Binatus sp.]
MAIKIYLLIFAILVGSTAGEVTLIQTNLGYGVIATIIIALAGAKAVLVALFFQHLKDEPKALSSIVLLALLAIVPLLTLSFLQIHAFH